MTRLINMRQLEYSLSVADEVAELKMIADDIKKLEFNKSWTDAFLKMALTHGWGTLGRLQKRQMKIIATTDSKAVFTLANKRKDISLSVLEELSTKFDSEDKRLISIIFSL